MKKLLIAETDNFDKTVLISLRKYYSVDAIDISVGDLKTAFRDYDIIWFRLKFRINEDILSQEGCKVKIIICPVTGLDHIDIQACKMYGVKVLSLKGEYNFLKEVRATAEHTIALSLALIRVIVPAANDVKAGNWQRDYFKGQELFNKKIAIFGYGRLGQLTADYFASFGAKPIVYDKRVVNSIYPVANDLKDLLQEAFIVSLHINYSLNNRGLFNQSCLDLMTDGAFFINTSRGSLVNEKDIVKALETGKLAGVATDVVNNEPNIQESLLWNYAKEHRNVLITPHIGGNTFESFQKTEEFMLRKLRNYDVETSL